MKKSLALLLALTLALFVFAGCASDKEENTNVITIGASATPHAEILEQVTEPLKEMGYELKIVIYDDYVLPNTALNDGEIDANYFQHKPYLDDFNAKNGTELASAFALHYEPFGIYQNGVKSLDELKKGATIIIPADDSNETRALLLLQQEGLITLPEDASAIKGVTTLDIIDDGGFDIKAVQADTVPAQLKNSDEGTIAIINGNYAIQAGLSVKDALAIEDATGDAATTYGNIIAVKVGNENSEKTKALVDALNSEAVKKFIEEKYEGAVVPLF